MSTLKKKKYCDCVIFFFSDSFEESINSHYYRLWMQILYACFLFSCCCLIGVTKESMGHDSWQICELQTGSIYVFSVFLWCLSLVLFKYKVCFPAAVNSKSIPAACYLQLRFCTMRHHINGTRYFMQIFPLMVSGRFSS